MFDLRNPSFGRLGILLHRRHQSLCGPLGGEDEAGPALRERARPDARQVRVETMAEKRDTYAANISRARLSTLDQTEKVDGGGHASQIAEALEPAAERRDEAQRQQRHGAEAAHDSRDVQRNASDNLDLFVYSFWREGGAAPRRAPPNAPTSQGGALISRTPTRPSLSLAAKEGTKRASAVN